MLNKQHMHYRCTVLARHMPTYRHVDCFHVDIVGDVDLPSSTLLCSQAPREIMELSVTGFCLVVRS